jgi:tRNA 2-thiouridine synthesizing protein A
MGSTGCLSLATEPIVLDARGLKCPLPVLKMEKQLSSMTGGEVLVVLATDPMAKIDIPLYCRQNGYDYVLEDDGSTLRFTITKA